MPAKREYRRRRGETQAAILDALVDRNEEGMTVLELRARVDADIDDIEEALGVLKSDGLIVVEQSEGRTLIKAADRVIPDGEPEPEQTFLEWLRDLLSR